MSVLIRKAYSPIVVGSILLTFVLTACGGNTSSSVSTPSSPTSSISAATAATAFAITKLATLVGQPTVKMLTGTTFEANGQLKNNDSYQHDFTLKVTLLDASGKVIASATQLVDNVKGGATVSYSIQGTTTQPTWTSVEIAVIKVTENINGSGND